jgi:DNA-directed RNA polymerase specialized sigma24 family protein
MTTTLSPTHSCHVLVRLQREWDRTATRPDAIARAASWGVVRGQIRSLDDVLVATGIGRGSDRAGDEQLATLVRLAATDELAARTVLQRILPNLSAVVRCNSVQFGPSSPERLELLEEFVAAAWTVIRTFNPDRRPGTMAHALAFDARDLVLRQHSRRKWTVHCVSGRALDRAYEPVEAADDPLLELAELVRQARTAGMSDDDLEFVRTYLQQTTTLQLARDLDVTPRTVRNRRDAVVARLRELVPA